MGCVKSSIIVTFGIVALLVPVLNSNWKIGILGKRGRRGSCQILLLS